jgi:hypothetical protein
MAAEQKLVELLEKKQSRSLDPSMLALAGQLFNPGRTGSLGEAVGRGAEAYAAAQQVQNKQELEDAAMRMQLQQMMLDRQLQAQGLKKFQSLRGPQPASGGQPAVTEGQTPPGSSGPALNVQGVMITPDDITEISMTNPKLGKVLEDGYKLKYDSITTQPGFVVDKATGKFTPVPGQEAKPEPVPEINATLLMPPVDAQRLRDARAKGDVKTVYSIIDLYNKGVGPRPAAPLTEGDSGSGQNMSIESQATKAAAEKEKATKFAGDYAEKTAKFLANSDELVVPRAAAAQNKEILQRNPKIVGLLNKPGVGNAIWSFLNSSVNAHTASGRAGLDVDIKRADLEQELKKLDPNFKMSDFEDFDTLTGNLARMELGMRRQIYAGSGMGAVSNLEGQPIKEIVGSRFDSPKALMRKMQLVGRSYDFDMDTAQAYRDWASKPGNENKHIEDFKRDKKSGYTQLRTEFESWLHTNLGIPYRKKGKEGGTRPVLSSQSIMEEIKRRKIQED